MKILILSHAQYITVGLPKIIEFAESLAALGNDVTLCVTSKTKRMGVHTHMANGVRVIEAPSLLFGSLRNGADPFDALNRIVSLKKKRFDVLHCVASRPTVFYPGVYLKKSHGTTLVCEWEESFSQGGVALERSGKLYYKLFGWIERYFEESILDHADGVIVVSGFLRKRAMELGVHQQRILQQIKGTSLVSQTFPSKSEARKQVLSPEENAEIILSYVGSIYDSDLVFLMRAFEETRKAHTNIRLRLIGFNRRFPMMRPNGVTILPRIPYDDYITNLVATDVFLLPLKCSIANISRYPSKFGDFLAVGRPVVATPLPEIRKIIEDADCGYLSCDDSIGGLSKAMTKAISTRITWNDMGERAKAYAVNNLSWNNIARRVVDFYTSVQRN